MSANIRDYARLAAEIRDQVGEQNIVSAAHCATRLRLVLRESPPAGVTKRISELPAVIQVLERGGQYQIVIGVHAKDVYEELVKLLHLDEPARPAQKQGILARVIATMSAVFAPFVYILAAAGLVQGALILLTQWIPAFPDTGTYAVVSFISWTPFTFLPAMIAVTASKHFKCNTFIAMWCCLALVNADWGALAARIAGGETIRFLVFPMAQTTYTSTVLPPLFLVLVLSYLALCLLPAIGEELFFRGALQGLMRPCGSAAAIFAPALLFALLHLDLAQGITAFLGGLFLGWLAERTGSILPCMLLHLINNTIAFADIYLQLYAPGTLATAVELAILLGFPLLAGWLVWRAVTRQGFSFEAGLRPGAEIPAVFSSPAYTLAAAALAVLTLWQSFRPN